MKKRLIPALFIFTLALSWGALAADLRNKLVYFVYLDRFFDGNQNNNFVDDWDTASNWPGAATKSQSYDYFHNGTPNNLSDWKRFWGGDLQGLNQKLPYLADLGVGCIYITCPVKQTDAQPAYRDANGVKTWYTAYHGYWMKDFYRIDEHWAGPTKWNNTAAGAAGGAEGWAVFDSFISKARALGLEVMVDIPINHSNPADLGFGADKNKDGNYDDGGETTFPWTYDGFPEQQFLGGTAGWGESGAVYKDKVFKAAFTDYYLSWVLNANNDEAGSWFFDHMHYNGYDCPNATTFMGFGYEGLASFNHRLVNGLGQSSWGDADFDPNNPADNPQVYDYLLGGLKKFVDHGVYNFRFDATKHVELPFLRKITAELKAYGASLNPAVSIYIVGEWSGSGFPTELGGDIKWFNNDGPKTDYARFWDYYYWEPTENFDFQLQGKLSNAFAKNAGLVDLMNYCQSREDWFNQFSDTCDAGLGANPEKGDQQVNMLNNQDQNRFMQDALIAGVPAAKRKPLLDLAVAFLLTSRGIPMLFYGDELYLSYNNGLNNGFDDHDPYNRLMMPTGFDQLKVTQPGTYGALNSAICKLAQLRKENTAVAQGSWLQRWIANDVAVFERRSGNNIVLVCINKGDANFAFPQNQLYTKLPINTYKDYLNGDLHFGAANTATVANVAANAAGDRPINGLTLKAREAAVFVSAAGAPAAPIFTNVFNLKHAKQNVNIGTPPFTFFATRHTFTWDPVYGATNYEIKYKVGNAAEVTVNQAGTSFSFNTSAISFTAYSFKVRAKSATAAGGWASYSYPVFLLPLGK